jgi:hypothetical protein
MVDTVSRLNELNNTYESVKITLQAKEIEIINASNQQSNLIYA